MNETPTPRPLTGPLRTRLNKLAHTEGQRHEHALRISMLAQLQRARDSGESFAQMSERVSAFEQNLGA